MAQSGADPAGTDIDALIETNVLVQLDDLANYPAVRSALEAGLVTLHGWVYDIGTGIVRAHDGQEFVPLNS